MEEQNKEKHSRINNVVNVVSSEGFCKVPPETQAQALEVLQEKNKMEIGIMGKIFGTNKALAPIYVSFAICGLLVFIVVTVNTQSVWDKIIPILAATIGYIFGKGSRNDE